ncbi:hypothetical protein [Kineococcus sp. SYSU DK005]|uniref:hypothetical protein n=1 Tax=Kineococcus sp. SYSU DK005 TaxID=3383126 RepID=UPI003D7E5897
MKRPARCTGQLGQLGLLALAGLALTVGALAVVPGLGDEVADAAAAAPPVQAGPTPTHAPAHASPVPGRAGLDPDAELVHPFLRPAVPAPGAPGPSQSEVLGPGSVQVPTRTQAPRVVIRPA